MRTRLVNPWFVFAHVVALHAVVLWFIGPGQDGPALGAPVVEAPTEDPLLTEQAVAEGALAPAAPAFEVPALRPGPLDLSRVYADDGHILADLDHDWTAELTTDAALQAAASRALDRAKVPFGAVVVLDPKSGDVLAMADRYDERHPVAPALDPEGPPHLALRALAPAASVFKMVTAVGLLEAGVSPRRAYPYTSARRRVYAQHLEAPGPGAPTADMGDALAHSNNSYFARLADAHLPREALDALVRRVGFNRVVPFPLLTDASTAQVPRNALERARMAAGFWHDRLTPLHAALLASAIATDGTMPTPRLVKRLRTPDGRTVDAPQRGPFATAMAPAHAKALRGMLAETVARGTARRAFSKWPRELRDVKVAGKTGTLAIREPYTHYTWFVGFAPVDDPQVAIAVMVGNGELWWQKAPDVARVVLEAWFEARAEHAVATR
ncbi:MAG: penicillin-binding protein [Myxococcales bacterium]|nr:penicillin-binding protein [Myxococcales bacterium]